MKRGKTYDWFPLWVEKWLWGSTRLELDHDERAIWIDLLALASKDDGFIRANEKTPYLLEQLSGIFCCDKKLLESTIKKCVQFKKLQCLRNRTLRVVNWEEYQLTDRHKRRLMSGETDTTAEKKDAKTYTKTETNTKTKTETQRKTRTREKVCVDKSSIIEKWREFAKKHSLAEIESISGQREKHLRARISSEDFFDFDELLLLVEKQPFLLGKNKSGWRITFDWIVNLSNYTKITEKTYVDRKPSDKMEEYFKGVK